MSGHIFFAHRYYGYDDAIYSGARLLEGLSQKSETLDEFLASLPKAVNTPEIRVDCPDDVKFDLVDRFVKVAKEQYKDDVLSIDGNHTIGGVLDYWASFRRFVRPGTLVLLDDVGVDHPVWGPVVSSASAACCSAAWPTTAADGARIP